MWVSGIFSRNWIYKKKMSKGEGRRGGPPSPLALPSSELVEVQAGLTRLALGTTVTYHTGLLQMGHFDY